MSPTNRQRVKLWAILLVVLAATYWVGQRIYDVPTPVDAADAGSMLSVGEADLSEFEVAGDFRDWSTGEAGPDGPRRNPFEYGPEPRPETPVLQALPPARSAPLPAQPTSPPPPPPPPPIPFRYSGYSSVGPGGQLQAWLFEEGEAYGVVEQEVLMGRYRIITITAEYVEVEDLEYSRRQQLPLLIE
jgi:hypothetical protein